VADIIRAVEEPLDSTQCGGRENCHDSHRCMTHDLWEELNTTVFGFLDGVKLSQLVEKQRTQPVSVVRHPKSREPHPVSA
jgi:Rrf2 family iron-sulfur cluster assembly transcriptional regulator